MLTPPNPELLQAIDPYISWCHLHIIHSTFTGCMNPQGTPPMLAMTTSINQDTQGTELKSQDLRCSAPLLRIPSYPPSAVIGDSCLSPPHCTPSHHACLLIDSRLYFIWNAHVSVCPAPIITQVLIGPTRAISELPTSPAVRT